MHLDGHRARPHSEIAASTRRSKLTPVHDEGGKAQSALRATARAGTTWTAVGVAVSSAATLATSLLLVARARPEVFADFSVLTVTVLMLGTLFRFGTDRIFIGEVRAAVEYSGDPYRRGSELVSFAVFAGVVGGLLLLTDPVSDLMNALLAEALSATERMLLAVWLASEVVRTVVAEGHRFGYRYRLAAVAGTGLRAPAFLVMGGIHLALGMPPTRSALVTYAAGASLLVLALSLSALDRRFAWWGSLPLGRGRSLLTSHPSMVVTTFAATAIGGVDVLVAGAFLGPEAAARYAFAVAIVGGIGVLSSVISLGLATHLARGVHEPENRPYIQALVVRYVRGATLLAALLYIGLVIAGETIAVGLGGPAYRTFGTLIAFLGLGQLLGVAAGPGGAVLILARRYATISAVTVAVAIGVSLSTVALAWSTRSEFWVAAASGLATAAVHVISGAYSARRLGMHVHAFAGRPPTP